MSAANSPDGRETVIDGLHVQSFGSPDAPAILMSAGLGGSGAYWAPQVASLAIDHFVILYDHRGTARSERTPLPPAYDVFHMAADMRAVLDGLRIETAHVIGHAAGGVAGLALAAQSPRRVDSLTVVNGWLCAPRHFRRCMEIRRGIFMSGGAQAYLKAQPIYLYPAQWIEENMDHLDSERIAQADSFQSAETLFARMEALERFDFRHEAPRFATRTLLIMSDDDMLVPASASLELAQALPAAQLQRFATGGHAVNVTRPNPFNEMVRSFLQ